MGLCSLTQGALGSFPGMTAADEITEAQGRTHLYPMYLSILWTEIEVDVYRPTLIDLQKAKVDQHG